MKQTLRQPTRPVGPTQGRRLPWGPACVAILPVLLVAGLGLVGRTTVPATPRVGGREERARAAVDSLRSDPVADPSASLQEILDHPDVIPSHHHPLLGRQAPEFELADPDGKLRGLGELRDGHPAVLIFSYGLHCMNCVRQLSDVDRDLPLFRAAGARVVGISADPPESTGRYFRQHGPFGFPVLSDPGNKVAQVYQVFRPAPDGEATLRHGTFVFDRGGTVRWVNVGDAPFRRNPALLYQLARIEGRLPSVQAGP